MYNLNTIHQDDFVCDNNQYYLNNNDCGPASNNDYANSIQAVVATIIEVRMNGMLYIPAKKKYILYLLIPKKKLSSHTSKKKISPSYITKEVDTVPLTDDVVPKIRVCGNDTVPFYDASTNSMVPETKSTVDTVVYGTKLASFKNNSKSRVGPVSDNNSMSRIDSAIILVVESPIDTNNNDHGPNILLSLSLLPLLSNVFRGLLSCNDLGDNSSPHTLSSSPLLSNKVSGMNNDNPSPNHSPSSLSLSNVIHFCCQIMEKCLRH